MSFHVVIIVNVGIRNLYEIAPYKFPGKIKTLFPKRYLKKLVSVTYFKNSDYKHKEKGEALYEKT